MKKLCVVLVVLMFAAGVNATFINDNFESYTIGSLEPQSIYTTNAGDATGPFSDVFFTNGSQAVRQWNDTGSKRFSCKTVNNYLGNLTGDVEFSFDFRIDGTNQIDLYMWGDAGRPLQMYMHTNGNIGYYRDGTPAWGVVSAVLQKSTWYQFASTIHFKADGTTNYDFKVSKTDGTVIANVMNINSFGSPTKGVDIQINSGVVSPASIGTAYFDNLRVVPEPATLALLGLGCLVLQRKKA